MEKPRHYQAIMVSSTGSDLESHRQVVIRAIQKFGFKANAMEHDGARADVDVIDSSLNMVGDSAAHVGIISHKYGQIPPSPDRNPKQLSITELEFNRAMELGRPIVLFIMGDNHPVTEQDIELDPPKRAKLKSFRLRAKHMRDGSEVERVYEMFDSLEAFSTAAAIAIGRLERVIAPPKVISMPPATVPRVESSVGTVLDHLRGLPESEYDRVVKASRVLRGLPVEDQQRAVARVVEATAALGAIPASEIPLRRIEVALAEVAAGRTKEGERISARSRMNANAKAVGL